MALRGLAEGLAATYYAATLTPDPTLDKHPDPTTLAAYRAKGQALASTLLQPSQQALIRCPCSTKQADPDRPSRVIATVNDRNLLVIRTPRGYIDQGVRLITHVLVHLPLAFRDGFTSARVWCYGCAALHDLGLRWLQRAHHNQISTPSQQFTLDPWGTPVTPPGYTPRHPNDAPRLAFARVTGSLHGPTIRVTLPFLRVFDYRDRFGFRPPHKEHLLHLAAVDDDRLQEPGVIDLLLPELQWGDAVIDLDDPEHLPPTRPLTPDELTELARIIPDLDPDEREEARALLPRILQPQDLATLQELLTEEPR